MADSVQLELKGLNQIIKSLKGKLPNIRIGILGSGSRAGGESTNADIGAVHEFGSPGRNIPQRSFLRVPISENLEKELEKSGLIKEETLKEVIKLGTIIPWMSQIAVAAEAIVDDAFESSGDGKWPPWQNPNYTNQGGMLLVDTGQLRQSVTSEVTK